MDNYNDGCRYVLDSSITATSSASFTAICTENDGGYLVPPELQRDMIERIATNATWTDSGGYLHLGYDANAEARADSLLKESFPELHKQFKEKGYCEFDSVLYPIRYTLTPSRVCVNYREKQIGFICVSASYSMPPSDRVLQMILHFRKDETYVLRVGNWNGNIGHSAFEHFKKSFSKKGGKMVYRPPRRKKSAWWNIDWLDFQLDGE